MHRSEKACRGLLLLAMITSPSLAWAHPGHGHAAGMLSGLLHPLTGPDHIAAMVAVGLWAAQLGGRALWQVPLAFVSLMALSAAMAVGHAPEVSLEPGIPVSVLLLGLLVAVQVRMPTLAAASLVGAFAICHGQAHGAEMPATASGLAYGAGFVMATAMLHASGIALGLLSRRINAPRVMRLAGLSTAAFGLYLCLG